MRVGFTVRRRRSVMRFCSWIFAMGLGLGLGVADQMGMGFLQWVCAVGSIVLQSLLSFCNLFTDKLVGVEKRE
jgi:hypothetical protein